MEQIKNKIVLGLMLLTVIVSGCTGGNQDDESSSSSVTVSEFSPFPNPVPSGQNVQFRMELVNEGDSDAGNVYARLYNPPFGNSGDQVWRPTSGVGMSPAYRTLKFDTLRSAGDQTPAVPQTRQKDFESPNLGEDREVDYTFNSNVLFNYSTTGTAEVKILGEKAYRDQQSPQSSADLENSDAPVQLEVRTPTPIPIYETSETPVEKQFCVIARNQGSGTVFDPDSVPDNEDFSISEIQEADGKLQIAIPDVGNIEFNNDEFGDERNYKEVEILDGKGVACFQMEINDVSDTFQTTVPIRVDADYGYMKETRTNVRVEGR